MGKKTTTTTRVVQRSSAAEVGAAGEDVSRSSIRRTVQTTEVTSQRRLNTSACNSSFYEYKEDPWEFFRSCIFLSKRSPKTDYTYSRTASYSQLYLDADYVSPNMSRRRLHRENQPCGDLLSASTSFAISDLQTRSGNKFNQSTLNKRLEYAGESSTQKEMQMHHLYGLDNDLQINNELQISEEEHHEAIQSRSVLTLLTYIITISVTTVIRSCTQVKDVSVSLLSGISQVSSTSLIQLWKVVKYCFLLPTSVVSYGLRAFKEFANLDTRVDTRISRWRLVERTLVRGLTLPIEVWSGLVSFFKRSTSSIVLNLKLISASTLSSVKRSRSCCCCLPLLLLLFLSIAGLYYWFGSSVINSVPLLLPPLLNSSTKEQPVVVLPVVSVEEQSSGSGDVNIIAVGVPQGGASSCGCPPQNNLGLVPGFSSREELEQWIKNQFSLSISDKMGSIQKDLIKLQRDIQGWTTRYITSELDFQRDIADNKQKMTIDAAVKNYQAGTERLELLASSLEDLKHQISQLASSSIDNEKYAGLVARLDVVSADYDKLAIELQARSSQLDSLTDNFNLLSESRNLHSTQLGDIAEDVEQLQVAVGQLNVGLDSLSQRSTSCCRSEAQLTAQVRVIIYSYMSKALESGAKLLQTASDLKDQDQVTAEETGGIAVEASVDDNELRSRTALAAWLGSLFAHREDTDAKLSALAENIALDINTKVKEAATSAAAIAVENKLAEDAKKSELADKDSVLGLGLAASLQQDSIDQSSCAVCDRAVKPEDVQNLIVKALKVYDADKTGKVDFALESAGGCVINTRCSETYRPRTALLSMFGIPLWYAANSPRVAIQPGVQPGECWPFMGSQGYLVVQLSAEITVTEVSIEHIPESLSPTGRIDSAPKDFSILGLLSESDSTGVHLGNFTYSVPGEPVQFFSIQHPQNSPKTFHFVELRIHSNHGHQQFTCLYRFRVHGILPAPS